MWGDPGDHTGARPTTRPAGDSCSSRDASCVSIEGRWTSTGGRVEFDIRRINDRVASGRLTIRREGRSFSTIDGEGRTSGGRFSLVFAAR
jgi:hypothetical protein